MAPLWLDVGVRRVHPPPRQGGMGGIVAGDQIWLGSKPSRNSGRVVLKEITDLISLRAVIDRKQSTIDPSYASWAAGFVIINLDYCKDALAFLKVMKYRLHLPVSWQRIKAPYALFVRQMGQVDLYLRAYDDGWIIERVHPGGVDRDPRILAYILGDLPILCPNVWVAAVLAEAACAPVTKSRVYWHEYW